MRTAAAPGVGMALPSGAGPLAVALDEFLLRHVRRCASSAPQLAVLHVRARAQDGRLRWSTAGDAMASFDFAGRVKRAGIAPGLGSRSPGWLASGASGRATAPWVSSRDGRRDG